VPDLPARDFGGPQVSHAVLVKSPLVAPTSHLTSYLLLPSFILSLHLLSCFVVAYHSVSSLSSGTYPHSYLTPPAIPFPVVSFNLDCMLMISPFSVCSPSSVLSRAPFSTSPKPPAKTRSTHAFRVHPFHIIRINNMVSRVGAARPQTCAAHGKPSRARTSGRCVTRFDPSSFRSSSFPSCLPLPPLASFFLSHVVNCKVPTHSLPCAGHLLRPTQGRQCTGDQFPGRQNFIGLSEE
jgi:hypothetical protein